MFSKATRIFVISLLAIGGVALLFAYNIGLAQQGGLTPPPKPTDTKVERNSANEGGAFVVGEKLTYNVAWSRFGTAARLETEVVERGAFFGQEGYQIRTKAETAGDVKAIFFEMYNQYTSYVSARNMQTYRMENSIRQGSRVTDETVILDQMQKEIRFNDQSTLALASDTYDLTTMLYVLRQAKLQRLFRQATH
jgi:hypothetical protein